MTKKQYPFLSGTEKKKSVGGKCIICDREGADMYAWVEVNWFRGDDDRVLYHAKCGKDNVLPVYKEKAEKAYIETMKIARLATRYGYKPEQWLENNKFTGLDPAGKRREVTFRELLLTIADHLEDMDKVGAGVTDTDTVAH